VRGLQTAYRDCPVGRRALDASLPRLQGAAAELNLYYLLAVAVLIVHLGWIVWVIFGWVVTWNRPVLRRLHILSLIYSILIEDLPWPCPLTVAETRLEQLAGT
jgi:hypothetical protein